MKIGKIWTSLNCCNYPETWTLWFCVREMSAKDTDRMVRSVDPDETAPSRPVCPKTVRIIMVILMNHDMTKPAKWVCAQQRLRSAWASVQSDQSSLCAQWVGFLHADREDSDQTGRMPRLIWVFTGRTLTLLVLSCRGSHVNLGTIITICTKRWTSLLLQLIHSSRDTRSRVFTLSCRETHLRVVYKHASASSVIKQRTCFQKKPKRSCHLPGCL